jgi:hypothetical protein
MTFNVVEIIGFEPMTFPLSAGRTSRLSYTNKKRSSLNDLLQWR